jgi:hypothetical protein
VSHQKNVEVCFFLSIILEWRKIEIVSIGFNDAIINLRHHIVNNSFMINPRSFQKYIAVLCLCVALSKSALIF